MATDNWINPHTRIEQESRCIFCYEKWPCATRKLFISPFIKRMAVIKTFIQRNDRAQHGNCLEGFLEGFFKTKIDEE